MATIILNGVSTEVPDLVAKYITDLEGDVKRAQADAKKAIDELKVAEQQAAQAVAEGVAKVKAAEKKLIGWVEARVHSFFLALDGDFRSVKAFLTHLTAGLDPHMQPQTLTASPSAPAPVQSVTIATQTQPVPAAEAAPIPAPSSEPAPAQAAPASPAAQPAASQPAPAPGSPA
jgi:hypothetical protein